MPALSVGASFPASGTAFHNLSRFTQITFLHVIDVVLFPSLHLSQGVGASMAVCFSERAGLPEACVQ
ncbi:hypothetical protein Q4485_17425 [Granulosicoccaceae sp. 1_MG-2023]|nr:hypothetical protein [Granulosicoccaceae sp. 1_MG-2023]